MINVGFLTAWVLEDHRNEHPNAEATIQSELSNCLKAQPKSAHQEQRMNSEFFRSSWNLAPYIRDPLMESWWSSSSVMTSFNRDSHWMTDWMNSTVSSCPPKQRGATSGRSCPMAKPLYKEASWPMQLWWRICMSICCWRTKSSLTMWRVLRECWTLNLPKSFSSPLPLWDRYNSTLRDKEWDRRMK